MNPFAHTQTVQTPSQVTETSPKNRAYQDPPAELTDTPTKNPSSQLPQPLLGKTWRLDSGLGVEARLPWAPGEQSYWRGSWLRG